VFVGTQFHELGTSVLVWINLVTSEFVAAVAFVSVPSQFGAYTPVPPVSREKVSGPLPPSAWFVIESPEKSTMLYTLGVP
jgi:hypothetical protein